MFLQNEAEIEERHRMQDKRDHPQKEKGEAPGGDKPDLTSSRTQNIAQEV